MKSSGSSPIPEVMHAFVLTRHGDLDALEYRTDWPVPVVGDHEVLIQVGACGLNNTDVNTRSGWYSKTVTEATTGSAYAAIDEADPSWGGAPISFPRIQGADAVGVVVACGSAAPANLLGKRVMVDCWLRDWSHPLDRDRTGYFGSECDGGFAQYTAVDYRNVAPVKSDLPDAALATFSCSYTTAEGMISRAGVTSDDVVLVTGASGGVGSAAIQLARRRGARVVALASEAKHADLAPLGADVLLPRAPAHLRAALREHLGRDTVSVVIDVVGGAQFGSVLDTLERGGRYACSGAIAGPMVEMDLRTFYLRDLTLHGSTVIPPGIFNDLVGYIERGEIQPMLAATWPLAELPEAQTAFIDKRHAGNLVVVPPRH